MDNNIKPMDNSHNLIEAGSYKGKVLLALLDGSKRFKEIARTANVHDALVVRALTEFLKKGLVTKTEDGLYSLTEDGRRVAEIANKEARLYSLFEKAKASDPDSLEAVLELHLQLKELDRRVSLINMHEVAFTLFSISVGTEYILPAGKSARLSEIVLILHEYLKKIFRDISRELENKTVYLMTSMMGEKDDAKSKAKEQIVKLRFARELLKGVKLEALTEDERKLALEIQDILNSFVPTKEYFRQLEEERIESVDEMEITNKDYTTKKLKLLYACREPKRFTDLFEEVGVSKAWLSEALKDLAKKGFVSKTSDDRYVLTEKGRVFIEEREVMELVREAIRKLGAETVKKNIEEILRSMG